MKPLIVVIVASVCFALALADDQVCLAHSSSNCVGEFKVDSCDKCNLVNLQLEQTTLACALPNVTFNASQAEVFFRCFDPRADFSWNTVYNIPVVTSDSNAVYGGCMSSRCCCPSNNIKIIKSPNGESITFETILSGFCGLNGGPQAATYRVKATGASWAIIQDFLHQGTYIIMGDTSKIDIRSCSNNVQCDTLADRAGPSAGGIVAIVIVSIAAFVGLFILINYLVIRRRKYLESYRQV